MICSISLLMFPFGYNLCFFQGFLLPELVTESCDKLRKQSLSCNENLMKNLEELDTIVSIYSNLPSYCRYYIHYINFV